MQTAIDRVIRSFTFRNAFSAPEPRNDAPAAMAREQAADRAAELLGHYRDTLAARTGRPD
jgi:hypothetical protein